MKEFISMHRLLDELLARWETQLGKDATAYRNHCYRVLNFYAAQVPRSPETLTRGVIAAAYHDLGIWSHGTFDYLAPSARLARDYLVGNGLGEWEDEVASMIENHHKLTRCDRPLVEAFRRADWLDVSLGVLNPGLERGFIRAVQKAFPDAGFHRRLVELTARHTLRQPWKPLPMFRW